MNLNFWQITILAGLLVLGLLNAGGFLILPIEEGDCGLRLGGEQCVNKCSEPERPNHACTECVAKDIARKQWCEAALANEGRCRE